MCVGRATNAWRCRTGTRPCLWRGLTLRRTPEPCAGEKVSVDKLAAWNLSDAIAIASEVPLRRWRVCAESHNDMTLRRGACALFAQGAVGRRSSLTVESPAIYPTSMVRASLLQFVLAIALVIVGSVYGASTAEAHTISAAAPSAETTTEMHSADPGQGTTACSTVECVSGDKTDSVSSNSPVTCGNAGLFHAVDPLCAPQIRAMAKSLVPEFVLSGTKRAVETPPPR